VLALKFALFKNKLVQRVAIVRFIRGIWRLVKPAFVPPPRVLNNPRQPLEDKYREEKFKANAKTTP
jgi:hypothetical protein